MNKYNKLVRDLIPDIIRQSGANPVTRTIGDHDEYVAYLNAKLNEEVAEYQESKNLEELADIQEVIYSLIKAQGLSLEDFENLRLSKKKERGGFDCRMLLIEVKE